MIRRSCASVVLFAAVLVLAATASAETIVSDTIRTQTWTKAGSPYLVIGTTSVLPTTGTAIIPPGETLTIEPGVEVRLGPNRYRQAAWLVVQGRIHAVGTEAEIITFRQGEPDQMPFSAVIFAGADSSTFRHCRISGIHTQWDPIVITGETRVGFEHVEFSGISNEDQYTMVIAIRGGAFVTFDSCAVRDNWTDYYGHQAVTVADSSRAIFTGCEIVGNRSASWSGIAVGTKASAVLRRCLIARNEGPTGVVLSNAGTLELDHVTVAGNRVTSTRISTIWNSGMLVVRNSIISGNDAGIRYDGRKELLYVIESKNADIAYSIVEGGWPGSGNRDADPRFLDAANDDYRIGSTSPAIDAGDPLATPDPDGSRADMGYRPASLDPPAGAYIFVDPVPHIAATSDPARLAVSNNGWADLTVSGIDVPDSFSVDASLPRIIGPADSAVFSIGYRGTANVRRREIVVTHSVAGFDPVRVPLAGIVETRVSGPITGVLSAAQAPYRAVGTLFVPAGETLTIEPGVDVLYEPAVRFIIAGSLVAIGTESDSIRFIASAGDRWGGFLFEDGGAGAFRFARVSNSGRVVTSGSNAFRITDRGTAVTMSRSVVSHNQSVPGTIGDSGSPAFYVDSLAYAAFDTCVIRMNRNAVYATRGATVSIVGCLIADNGYGYYRTISVSDSARITMRRTIVVRNEGAMRVVDGAHADIDHVTLADNGTFGTGLSVYNASIKVRNSVIRSQLEVSPIYPSTIDIAYTLIANATGFGVFSAEPMFIDREKGDYRLWKYSPCIDAGDPAAPLDPDGTRADLGAIPFDRNAPLAMAPTSAPLRFALHPNAPNPFNPSTVIRFSLAQPGETKLAIYDVSGRLVRTLISEPLSPGAHEVAWDGIDAAGRRVASGVYVYRLTAKDGVLVRRMVLVR